MMKVCCGGLRRERKGKEKKESLGKGIDQGMERRKHRKLRKQRKEKKDGESIGIDHSSGNRQGYRWLEISK